jgi:hypothetical protein
MEEAQVVAEEEILVPENPPASNGNGADDSIEPAELTEQKIVALFDVYPVMSPTMLQAAIGPSLSPVYWRPVYNQMVAQGILIEWEVEPGQADRRSRPYKCIRKAAAAPAAAAAS